MLIYVNSLGITCLEPEEGHLIKKVRNGQIFKKVYLGKNDKVENYKEIVDVNYVYKEEEEKPLEDLAGIKQDLIKLSKRNLAKYLEEHPLESKVKYEDGRLYTVTLEKQNMLFNNIVAFQTAEQNGLNYPLEWNSVGEISEPWEMNQMMQLYIEMKEYTAPIVLLQQHIEKAINQCKSKEELQLVDMMFNEENIAKFKK